MNSIFDEMEADSDQGSLFSGHSFSKDDLSTLTDSPKPFKNRKILWQPLK